MSYQWSPDVSSVLFLAWIMCLTNLWLLNNTVCLFHIFVIGYGLWESPHGLTGKVWVDLRC